ncbi:MAG TPA: cobalamin B12-binding domain-containing protein [Chloroflexota bacterium]|nr:cobalamin B12-binding domain-containing protein [Chloroflexota bacterium]
MKILMVCTNSYRMIAPAPLGASLVASRLRKDGHRVRFLDLMFARDPAQEAARVAWEFGPDLVCYSIRNVDNQSCMDYFDPLPGIQAVVSAVRSACPSPSLLGGTAFTTFPAHFLKVLGADYGIAGDDLEPISRFVASLAAGSPDVSLPGLVHRENGQVKANPFRIKGYAGVEFDGWDLMDLRPYRRFRATSSWATCRGSASPPSSSQARWTPSSPGCIGGQGVRRSCCSPSACRSRCSRPRASPSRWPTCSWARAPFAGRGYPDSCT